MSELDHMDALAAEYVLGSLDFEERARARNLLEADATFAAKVQRWERRVGGLHPIVGAGGPGSRIWGCIKGQMPQVPEGSQAPQPPPRPPATAAPAPAEPPSLDAIEAAISQAATTLGEASSAATREPAPQPPSEVTTASEAIRVPPSEPTTVSEAMSVPASETASAPTAEVDVTGTSAVETVPSPPVAPVTAAAASEPVQDQAMESTTAAVHRRLRRWQAYAIFMTLVVAAVAALLAAWRFAPDRV